MMLFMKQLEKFDFFIFRDKIKKQKRGIKMEKELLNLFLKTEGKSNQINEQIGREILYKIEQKFGVKMSKKNSSLDMIIYLLMHPDFPYQADLIELLEKYHINKRSLLFSLVPQLYNSSYGKNVQNVFARLPYCRELEKSNDHYKIKTEYGMIEIFEASNFLLESGNFYKMFHKNFAGRCHEAVAFFKDEFKEAYITTSEIRDFFCGHFYHFYYTLKDGSTIDVSRNLYFPNDSFEEIFKPHVILKYPVSELEKRVKQDGIECGTLFPVIALALNEKRKILK